MLGQCAVALWALTIAEAAGSRWSAPDAQAAYMRRCVQLALEATAAGGGPFGAVIVDPGVGILAEGRNHAKQDPIWHGEMSAIANLSAVLGARSVYDVAPRLELYTSAEPCPMCMSAITWSGFGRVIYGTSIPFLEAHGGDQIDIRAVDVVAKSTKHIVVLGGLLANETDPLYARDGSRRSRSAQETQEMVIFT
mmetsp:Transcript_9002/g.21110  ORF Transcript_9002/g.21110 Transcript_9002/m.21110 type:complete len:194 (-) Transcript_9002:125-706(-)